MRYQHTVAYWIKGLYPQQEGADEEVISSVDFRAVLTNNPNFYCLHGDRMNAISKLSLDIFLGQLQPGTPQERIENVVSEIRELRQQRFGRGLFLIYTAIGGTEEFESVDERELEEFIVRSGVELKVELKEAIQLASRNNITTLLSALTLAEDNVLGFVRISDSVVFYRDDSKPIYCPALPSISAEAYSAARITPDTISSAKNWYQIVSADKELNRFKRQLILSMRTEDDRLRSFLSAWKALEGFVNKVFKTYEEYLFRELNDERYPNVFQRYLNRTRTVMNDKYRLIDKFDLIAFLLSPESADEDVEKLKAAKNHRDELSHHDDVNESDLPVEEVQALARKYFRLHLKR